MADSTRPRRRFQFRLRTLLIVVTLLSVACAVIIDRQRLARERDDALQNEADARATVLEVRRAMTRHAKVVHQTIETLREQIAEQLQAQAKNQ
jgi:hypothetical protein